MEYYKYRYTCDICGHAKVVFRQYVYKDFAQRHGLKTKGIYDLCDTCSDEEKMMVKAAFEDVKNYMESQVKLADLLRSQRKQEIKNYEES